MTRSRRRSSSEGAELVERYAASGLTQGAFAAAEGVKMATFQYWLRKARDSSGEETTSARSRFVEVKGDLTEASSSKVCLELGGGLRLRFESLPSPSYLAQVASAFGALSRC